jgi:hypothetical protein
MDVRQGFIIRSVSSSVVLDSREATRLFGKRERPKAPPGCLSVIIILHLLGLVPAWYLAAPDLSVMS